MIPPSPNQSSVPSPTPNWSHAPQAGDYINSIAVSADGGTVVGGTFKHTYSGSSARSRRAPTVAPTTNFGVYCYEGESGTLRWSDVFAAYEGVYWVAVSADGSRAAAGGNWTSSPAAGFVRAYDATSGALLLDYRTGARVNQVALSADGEWLISAADSIVLFQYDQTTAQYKKTNEFTPAVTKGHNEVISVGISADASRMVYCDYSGHVGYMANEGGIMAVFKTWMLPDDGFSHMLSLAPSGNCFAAGGANGLFYMFDAVSFLQSGEPTYSYATGVSEAVYGVAVAGDGKSFAGVVNNGDAGAVYLVNVNSGTPVLAATFPTQRNPNCVTINSEHGLMAVADGHPDGTPGHFYLYSGVGTAPVETWCYTTTQNMSWPVAIAANGSAVIGGSDDSSIYSFPI